MSARFTRLSCNDFGLKASRLLLPIDLGKCPPEIFPLANGFTKPLGGEIILLHVLDPRVKAAGRSDGVLRQAERHLARLGQEYLRPTVEVSFRVRTGIPHEEIRAEAAATAPDLLLLPTFAPSFWSRMFGTDHGLTERNLVMGSSLRIFAVGVRKHFNCFRRWAGTESRTQWAV